jgi:hypothetical protein
MYDFKSFVFDEPNTHEISEYLNAPSPYREALAKFTVEFCTAFGSKIDGIHAGMVALVTPEGFLGGYLSVEEKYSRKDGKREINYLYRNDMEVKKERGMGAERHTRTSSKLPTLIKSIRTKNEEPKDISYKKSYALQVGNALGNIKSDRAAPRPSCSSDTLLDFIEVIAGAKEATFEIKSLAEHYYKDHMKKMEIHNSVVDHRKRFNEGGFHIIGLLGNRHNKDTFKDKPRFLIGEFKGSSTGKFEAGDLDFRITNSVGEDSLVRSAMFHVKSRFENQNTGADNCFNVPYKDAFDEELDVVFGYTNHEVVFVLIPKMAAA